MTSASFIEVLSRCTAGIFAGYVLSSLFSIVFVKVLMIVWNQGLGDSVLIATMLGHALYFSVLVLCFCPFSQRQIWSASGLFFVLLVLFNYLITIP